MQKKIAQILIAAGFIITIGLSACQTSTPEPVTNAEETLQFIVGQTLTAAPTSTPLPTATSTPTPTLTPTPVLVSYGPSNFPVNINPLTGLEVDDPAILDRRPVMIKVANQMSGRPHAGLTNADIVFDYPTGRGGDRFLALFYGKDDSNVGTIRSGRYVDTPLVQMFNGILAMSGAYPPEFDEIVAGLGKRVINGHHCSSDFQAICDDGRNSETSDFANTAEMTKYYTSQNSADNSKQSLDGMAFATVPPSGGATAEQVIMHYGSNNNHQWNYDPATMKYWQSIELPDGSGNYPISPLVDRNNGQQLAFSNVVVLLAKIEVLNGDYDTMHRITFTRKDGRALICRDGKIYDVFYKTTWNQPFSFYDENGDPFMLQPGNTWIHITGLYSSVSEEFPGEWTINLGMP